jgi:hypothetical protein
MQRVATISATLAVTLWVICARAAEEKPKDGFVRDAATAIKIAVAVWEPLYGANQIAQEKPYRAYLKGDVWVVTARCRRTRSVELRKQRSQRKMVVSYQYSMASNRPNQSLEPTAGRRTERRREKL